MKKVIKSSQEFEYVSIDDYDDAFSELAGRYYDKGIHIINKNSGADKPIELGLDWDSESIKRPEEARVFAKHLNSAAEECMYFPYDGMKINYED